MQVEAFTPAHPLWPAYVAHIESVNMARWVFYDDGYPRESLYFLGAVSAAAITGHITLRKQPIVVPATEWSQNKSHPMTGPDGQPLQELFVYTFAVAEEYRRKGIGRALQTAALKLAEDTGCYQMRSWSSLDHAANYALKLSMGFAAHPAIDKAANGMEISGVFFVKVVQNPG